MSTLKKYSSFLWASKACQELEEEHRAGVSAASMSTSGFPCELGTTVEAIMITCRATGSAAATDTHEFPHGDGFSGSLFNACPIEINTFITNIHIPWPSCESVDLVLTFTAEGTLPDGVSLLLVVLPHMSSAFLSCLSALLPRMCTSSLDSA
jgi:hypothetical protein